MSKVETSVMTNQVESVSGHDTRLEHSLIPGALERARLEKRLNELLQGVPSDKQGPIADQIIALTELQYCDQREVFTGKKVPNKTYAKKAVRDLITQGNGNFCRIAFDLEGLKAINDTVGHEKGDRYLALVHSLLKETVADIKDQHPEAKELEFTVSAEGGDEFGVLITGRKDGEFDVAKTEINPFAAAGNEIAAKPVKDAFVERFNEKLMAADLSPIITAADLEKQFPGTKESGYEFFASASAGAIAYRADWVDEEVLRTKVKELRGRSGIVTGEREVEDSARFELYLDAIETALNANKEEFKQHLRDVGKNDSDIGRQFKRHIDVLARSAEYRDLLDENQRLQKENRRLQKLLEKTQAEMAALEAELERLRSGTPA